MSKVPRQVLLTPGPATTSESVKQAQLVPDVCPREAGFEQVVEKVRGRLIELAGGQEAWTAVLFSGSGTTAVEACISSVVPHDKKLLVLNNGAYGERMAQVAEAHGIEVIPYSIPWGTYPDVSALEALLEEHGQAISHLALVHHETTTGMLNPLQACVELAHRFGVEIIVDAVSSFGGIPMSLKQTPIDFLVSCSNKCVQGMAGIGFVVARRSSIEQASQIRPRSFSLDLHAQYAFMEKQHQFRFTPPVQVLYAFAQALDELCEETVEGRHRRYGENEEILVRGLEGLGFRFLLPPDHRAHLITCVREPEGVAFNFEAMHDALLRKGFTVYPGSQGVAKTFRLGCLGDLYPADMNSFIAALTAYCAEVGMVRDPDEVVS